MTNSNRNEQEKKSLAEAQERAFLSQEIPDSVISFLYPNSKNIAREIKNKKITYKDLLTFLYRDGFHEVILENEDQTIISRKLEARNAEICKFFPHVATILLLGLPREVKSRKFYQELQFSLPTSQIVNSNKDFNIKAIEGKYHFSNLENDDNFNLEVWISYAGKQSAIDIQKICDRAQNSGFNVVRSRQNLQFSYYDQNQVSSDAVRLTFCVDFSKEGQIAITIDSTCKKYFRKLSMDCSRENKQIPLESRLLKILYLISSNL